MKSYLFGPFCLLLLSSTVSGLGSVVSKNHRKISQFTWKNAQSYCHSLHYDADLITIYSQSDANDINFKEYYAWVGLHKEKGLDESDWIWSDGGDYGTPYWRQNEPDKYDNCAVVTYPYKAIYGKKCGEHWFFICQKQNGADLEYTFIPESKTWSEAQQYCRTNYKDLAGLTRAKMGSAVGEQDFPIWTGLHRDGGMWKWSAGLSDYTNWKSGEPGNSGNCVSISSQTKEMTTQSCDARFPYICLADNVVLVKESKTWEEALQHCRTLTLPTDNNLRFDLLSVQPGKEHNYVMRKILEANTEEVWSGLRFLAGEWLWVNGADMLYTGLPPCPILWQHCGALSKRDTGSVEPMDCMERKNFLCYRIQ